MAAELCNAVFSGVASKVAESLFDPIRREISYAFKYQSYVEKLRSQLVDLKNKRQRLEQTVKDAEKQGGEIYDDVQLWLDKTTELIERADKLINEDEDVAKNKRCFKGLCPNLMSRRKLSKEAVNAGNVATDLLTKGNFTNVSYLPAPERTELMNDVRGYQQFDSRMKIFQDVLEALKDDKVSVIGVYGMGGVGKTTLVKQAAKKVKEEKLLFDEVAMAEVTLNPDLKTIQDKIAYDLGLTFSQHESTLYARADRLRQRLKKEKRVLVILDNIWAKLDLEAVGIPSGVHDHRQCTILLTSRSQHVLCNDMNSQKTFSIEVLSDSESMGLFWESVGDHPSVFQPLAVEIVGKCGGLPIAIKTIGNALKNKEPPVWKDALNKLRNSNPKDIPGMEKDVYSTIKLSYDLLEIEEAKSLFQLCALQNGGRQILINNLMMYGIGLGWFKKVYTLEEGRNRVHTLIQNLKTSSLLLDGDMKHVVKMHDVIHDVAVSIATDKLMFNIQNVADFKKEQENTMQNDPTAISLPSGDIQELPERLECPKLKLFLLFAKYGSYLPIPDLFFEGMKELRVLHLTHIPLPALPSSFGCLINLETLSLDFCKLGNVAMVGELQKLEILSFKNSDITHLPLEIGQLMRLKLLDLSNCRSLKEIAPNVISKLSRLEELYMGNSFTQWEKDGGGTNASLVELKTLSKLTTLEIDIPNAIVMPQDLVSAELERYKICVGGEWNYWRDSESLGKFEWDSERLRKCERRLKLKGLDKSNILGSGMKKLLKNIEYLRLNELNGFQNVNELHDREVFQQLKDLILENDSKIVYIVNSVGQIAFPLLESLFLHNLINLEKVCQGQLTADQSFSKLRMIDVQGCHSLKHLFSMSMAQNCFRLQKIQVTNCKNLKLIIGEESENHIVRENGSIIFPQLHSLTLGDLPQLTSSGFDREISQTLSATTSASKEIVAEDDREDSMTVLFNNKVIFPMLEKLELYSLNIANIWLDQFSTFSTSPGQNLTELTVRSCSHMEFLFSYSMAKSLVRLQKLDIESCKSMERIIDTTMSEKNEEQMIESMIFPKLVHLRLWELPKLTRLMSSSSDSEENNILHTGTQPVLFDAKVIFPMLEILELSSFNIANIWLNQFSTFSASSGQNLTTLTVKNCSHMEFLFSYSMAKSLVRLQKLVVESCESMERIIDTAVLGKDEEQMVESMIFPKLVHLRLWELPKFTRLMSSSSDSEENNILHTGTQPAFFDKKVIFPMLEILELSSFNIANIWLNQFSTFSASPGQNLTKLTVKNCSHMKFLFSYSMAKSLVRLQKLVVESCESMERIIDTAVLGKDEEQMVESMIFPKLVHLRLWELPKLTRLMSSSSDSEENDILHSGTQPALFDEKVIFPMLEKLELSSFNIANIWLDQFSTFSASPGQNLRTLTVKNCNHMEFLFSYSMAKSLQRLQTLFIESCESMERIIDIAGFGRDEVQIIESVVFPKLYYLRLKELPKFKRFMFISSSDSEENNILHTSTQPTLFDEKVRFPSLEQLYIFRMENLSKIWQWPHQLTWDSFSKLNTLTISHCHKLTSVFSWNIIMGRRFKRLKFLNVKRCHSIEEIIEEDTNSSSNSSSRRFDVFPQLINLKLDTLPKLISIYKGIHVLEWPTLKDLYVSDCNKVEILFSSSELLESQQPVILVDHSKVSFPNLKALQVEECDGLRNLVTLSTAESQVKLARMEISNCKMIEKIIEIQVGEGVKEYPIVFRQLEYLELDTLPRLESFCLENYTLEFPNLEQVFVSGCASMKTFSQGVLDAPMLHKVQLKKDQPREERWEGNLNSTIQKLFQGMDRFYGIKYLKLSDFPSLKEIWDGPALAVSFFSSLKSLVLDNLTFMSSTAIPANLLRFLNILNELEVRNCDSIEEVFHLEDQNVDEVRVLPILKTLKLIDLPKLKRFCNSTGNTITLLRLGSLWIENCPNMETFISNSTPEQMTTNKEPQEMTSEDNFLTDIQPLFDEKVAFPYLSVLKLSKLPQLLHLLKENSHPINVFAKLRRLEIAECHKLRQLVPSSLTFENLTTLEISKCDALVNLVTMNSEEENRAVQHILDLQ